jgi:hypothetical protein
MRTYIYHFDSLHELDPQLHQECEALKLTFDMEPGDAIIHSRWLFHRSDDTTEAGRRAFIDGGSKPLMRYSIRLETLLFTCE